MVSRSTRLGLVLAICLAAPGCGGRSTPIGDAGGDADVDGDIDSDIDGDADSDSDGDGGQYWPFDGIELPGAIGGDYASIRIWALAENDVLLCSNDPVDERGGIAHFDGSEITVESDSIACEDVWGLSPDEAWAIAADPETGDLRAYRRDEGTWAEVAVDGAEGCRYEAMFQTMGRPMLLGLCDGEERRAWVRPGDRWAVTAMWYPSTDLLVTVAGGFSLGFETGFYGRGVDPADSIIVGSDDSFGYPSDQAIWAIGWPGGIVGTDGDSLFVRVEDGSWAEHPCPESIPSPEDNHCWRAGTSSPDGAVFLGGGMGSSGDWGSDDWRIHYWDGTALQRILEPCGGASPQCGVEDVSATQTVLYAVVGQNWNTRLVWAPIPD